MGEGPKISLAGRFKQLRNGGNVPGPGAYMPDYKKVKSSASCSGIGKGNKLKSLDNSERARNPGPGSYSALSVAQGPKYTYVYDKFFN